MNDIVSPLQSISYTNRDFVKVYEELLTLVKELSSTWDPSISNESDPGVILLKLNAIIADKCNYAIDKNILECFPLSVTQEQNARQLFEQLGYYMHWYISSTVDVFIKWIGEPSTLQLNIPKFTMVCDENENIVYTLIGESGSNTITDMVLDCSSNKGLSCKAIQGIAIDYEINGDKLITVSNLDSKNRLYFTHTDIAQNGIFITNAEGQNYSSWIKKDNLTVENLGNTFYKFGLTEDGLSCYLEFPEDVSTLFKEGIYITYIKTNGLSGNISAEYISKFYNLSAVIDSSTDTAIPITSDNVLVSNYSSAVGGQNNQDINDAYRGYKRTVGTFETLVTLRDYMNFINNSDLVSNCFVCDRTNDIQTTYKIISSINDIDQLVTQIEEDEDEKDLIDAFGIKFYLLQKIDNIANAQDYFSTFYMLNNDSRSNVVTYLDDYKMVNHDIIDILDSSPSNPHICYFINKCPLKFTIIPQSTLTDTQITEVRGNIINALFQQFNGKQVDFGSKFPYELVYNTIINADSRIKNVSLENIHYETYGIYYNSTKKLTYNATTEKWYNNDWQVENPAKYNLHPTNPIDGAVLNLPGVFEQVKLSNYDGTNDLTDSQGNKIVVDNTLQPDDLYFISNNNNIKATVNVNTYIDKCKLESTYPANCYSTITLKCTDVSNLYSWTLNGEAVNLTEYGISCDTPTQGDVITVEYSKTFADAAIDTSETSVTNPTVTSSTFINKIGSGTSSTSVFTYELVSTNAVWNQVFNDGTIDDNPFDLSLYGVTISGVIEENDLCKFRLSYSHQFRTDVYVKSVLAGVTQFFCKDEEFDYRLDGKFVDRIDNIDKVWSDVNITISNSNNTYTLKENEALQFYSPNLITGDRYSNYVKFEYKLTNNVNANSDYQLGFNEYIIFYWKESDNTFYRFRSYGYGTVIHPTFTITAYNGADNVASVARGTLIFDVTTNKYLDKIGYVGDADNNAISAFKSTEKILSASKNISIKHINRFSVPERDLNGNIITNNPLYWILNDSDGEYYTLFTSDQTSRILNTGEYLLVVNPTFTSYTLLGAGTQITRSNGTTENEWDNVWQVKKISATEILTNGLAAIGDNYFTINDQSSFLSAVENKFTSIGFGGKVRINPKDDSITTWSIEFSRDGYSITSAEDLVLKDFNIEYTFDNSEEAEWKTIDDVVLQEGLSLDGRSLLALNCDPTNYQILLSNQSIWYTINGDDTGIQIQGSDITTDSTYNIDYYPVAVMTSLPISSSGGEPVDTYNTSYSLDTEQIEYTYMSMYKFSKLLDTSTIKFGLNGSVNMTISPAEAPSITSVSTIPLRLPQGKYILTLKNYNNNLNTEGEHPASVSLLYDNTVLHFIGDSTLYDAAEEGVYYYELIIDDDNSHTLSISVDYLTMDAIFQINNCYKYLTPDGMTDEYFNWIRNWIKYLDKDNMFMYDIEVPDSKLIQDPLLPSNFFNTNHIYNQFTIPQIKNIVIQ